MVREVMGGIQQDAEVTVSYAPTVKILRSRRTVTGRVKRVMGDLIYFENPIHDDYDEMVLDVSVGELFVRGDSGDDVLYGTLSLVV